MSFSCRLSIVDCHCQQKLIQSQLTTDFFFSVHAIVRCNSSQWSMLALCSITIESIKLSFSVVDAQQCTTFTTSNRQMYEWGGRTNEVTLKWLNIFRSIHSVDTLNHCDAFASTWEINVLYNNSVYAFLMMKSRRTQWWSSLVHVPCLWRPHEHASAERLACHWRMNERQ